MGVGVAVVARGASGRASARNHQAAGTEESLAYPFLGKFWGETSGLPPGSPSRVGHRRVFWRQSGRLSFLVAPIFRGKRSLAGARSLPRHPVTPGACDGWLCPPTICGGTQLGRSHWGKLESACYAIFIVRPGG